MATWVGIPIDVLGFGSGLLFFLIDFDIYYTCRAYGVRSDLHLTLRTSVPSRLMGLYEARKQVLLSLRGRTY